MIISIFQANCSHINIKIFSCYICNKKFCAYCLINKYGWCPYYKKNKDTLNYSHFWALEQEICPRCFITEIKNREILYCIQCEEFINDEYHIEYIHKTHLRHTLITKPRYIVEKVYDVYPKLRLINTARIKQTKN